MLLAVKDRGRIPVKKAGVIWKMEKAKKVDFPLGLQNLTDLLTPVRFSRDFNLQNCKIINVCLSITIN